MRLCSTKISSTSSVMLQRGLCTSSSAASSAQPPQPRKPRGRNDTDYVKRRYGWREALREERLAFLRGEGLGAGDDLTKREEEKELRRPKKNPAVAQARIARRMERQHRHLEKLKEVQVKKAVRQEAKRQIWEVNQAKDEQRKSAELAAIEAAAHTWVNDSNLDDNLDRCVDAFFIADDASQHASSTGTGYIKQDQSYFFSEINKQ